MQKEIWKDVDGYNGMYLISSHGRVKSLYFSKERILKSRDIANGYLQVALKSSDKINQILVHRLVGKAFVRNKQNKPVINHKDGNKGNNYYKNLEWTTRSENILHSFRTGLNPTRSISVQQFDLDGNYINTYRSMTQACIKTGIAVSSIGKNCRNKSKRAGSFKWKYNKT